MTLDDQLSLHLDARRPGLPAGLRPMLPRTVRAPFDDADYLFEPWWGGERAFVSVESDPAPHADMVRIVNGRGRELGAALPELTGPDGLAARFGDHSAVVDGCLVVVGLDGRPDPSALAARLDGETGRIVVFLAFDLVALDGRPILSEPLERRRERLERAAQAGGSLLIVPAIAGEGRTLHAAAGVQGIPAIVGRHRLSPYLPGVRSRLWRLVRTSAGSTEAAPAMRTGSGGADGADGVPDHETDPGSQPLTGRSGARPIIGLILRLPLDGDGPA
jgi:bifunctional non-homologous end joining protein LigD